VPLAKRAGAVHRHGCVRAALGALLAFVLAACSAPPPTVSIGLPSASGGAGLALEAPDSSFPAAGICDRAAGTVATFELKFDTPIPRCLQVVATQRLEVINSTGRSVAVAFHRVAYILQPGEQRTFEPTFGSIWLQGDHTLHTSAYGGDGGPEIWLMAE